jgi:ketosteroid isomerase-like protein
MTVLIRSVVASLALLMSVPGMSADTQDPHDAKAMSAEQLQVVNTVKAIFAASEADDMVKFHSVIAPGFYIFDNGKRFDGDAIMELIKKLQAAGNRYEWTVTDPDVHVSGDSAWIAYVNRGSITNASGKHDQQWLESAVLQKQSGAWKIVFMQSTRVPETPPESHGN